MDDRNLRTSEERSDENTNRARNDDGPAARSPSTGTRRGYLRGIASFGVGTAGLGTAARVRGETTADRMQTYFEQFGTVVDVTEAGADDTGRESVTPVLREYADDDTLLVFPPGEYYMDEQFRFSGFTNFGLVGDDATIVPAPVDEFDGPRYRLFRLGVSYSPGLDLLFEGFTVDQTAADTGIRVVEAMVEDGLTVRDVTIDGKHDSGTWGPALFSVVDPSGTGTVERFEAPDGGAWVDDTPDPIGLWRGPSGILLTRNHRGTIELRDCVLGGFPDNGLYGVTDGTVRVIGGHYRNSNAANVRLAGEECVVRDTTVTVDENPENFTNQRGIRLDEGSNFLIDGVTVDLREPNGHAITAMDAVDSARVQNTHVAIGDRVNHGIVVCPETGPTKIVDTTVEIARGGNAIRIEGDDAGQVVCARVQVWGKASGARFRHAIRCERDDCEFRTVKVWQPGPDLRRAILLDGDDCLIYDGEFKTRHHPLLVNGAGAWIEGNYAECYDDYEAVRLNDGSSNATVKRNTLVGGVLDKGCDGLRMYGNDIE